MLNTTHLRLGSVALFRPVRSVRRPCPACGRARPLPPTAAPLLGARSASTAARPGNSRRFYPLALVFALPALFFWQKQNEPSLSPERYTDLTVESVEPLGPQHVLLSVRLDDRSRRLFSNPPSPVPDGSIASSGGPSEIIVQHVMLKSPDLQIERAYTPLTDPAQDGTMKIVVKRIKGGEVGRMVHSLRPGDKLGVRGPITTLSIIPEGYDKIVMVSLGPPRCCSRDSGETVLMVDLIRDRCRSVPPITQQTPSFLYPLYVKGQISPGPLNTSSRKGRLGHHKWRSASCRA